MLLHSVGVTSRDFLRRGGNIGGNVYGRALSARIDVFGDFGLVARLISDDHIVFISTILNDCAATKMRFLISVLFS